MMAVFTFHHPMGQALPESLLVITACRNLTEAGPNFLLAEGKAMMCVEVVCFSADVQCSCRSTCCEHLLHLTNHVTPDADW